ncbi:BTAD domain-containing putative transcriptional regulator [Streptomyces sp. GC420]|uniref:BTAD domain-containing putative transcriptional regulator n=1 Tax=Streptomyces sp. GC420 TaxID=2697568 RepID=UPI0014151DF0|nr:BTAD domain-containing putative transcriptional regulator [Streptomyces sp. GC420]NBM16043.1 AAA family ATPase [Streptomyces sp. GC420]
MATSELLGALWPDENRPTTARKIVQNAVWALRALFADETGDSPGADPGLITQAPGYVLRVDPERVDLHRFGRRVAEGRACLSTGRPEEAARLLSEALDEWHGPALADLAEAGTDWPELTALSQMRLDVMEDRFEAELRSGHHHSILGELVSLAEEEPLRERLCGQLMLALYRCGRQAEALDVFGRVRRSLVEEHGLEPSRELQLLQQNILTHDSVLAPPATSLSSLRAVTPPDGSRGQERAGEEPPDGRPAAPQRLVPDRSARRPAAAPATAGPQRAHGTAPELRTERRAVAVLLVRACFSDEAGTLGDPRTSVTLHEAVTAVVECVEEFGGTVTGSLGSVSVAVFGLRGDGGGASFDAVRAAVALRARLNQVPGPAWHAVVSAGEALVRRDPYDPAAPVFVVGRLVDEARSLLAAVPPGEIHINGDAVRDTAGLVRQSATARLGVRVVAGLQAGGGSKLPDPFDGYGAELSILRSLLLRTRRHDAPHLVTILGDQGVGKTRFLADFVRDIQGEAVRVVRVRAGDGARLTVCDVLRACCGLAASDTADGRLTEIVRRVAGHGETAERLLRRLCPGWGRDDCGGEDHRLEGETLDGWCDLLVLLAREQPLVLCVDDAQLAEDAVLDLVERLASESQDVPLFMVMCAQPTLLERRPFWGSGLRHSGTLTLEWLPGPGAGQVVGEGWLRELAVREPSGGGSDVR